MRRELPGVRHLVEDQPASEVLVRQVRVLLPLLDVGLDEVEPLTTDRLRAEKLRVVLAKDAPAEESKHVADVSVDAHSAHFDDERIGHAAGFEHRIDEAAKDAEVQIDPPLAVEGVEARHLDAAWQHTYESEQRLLELVRVGTIAGCRRSQPFRLEGRILEPGMGHVANLVPIEEQGGGPAWANRLGHRDGGKAEQGSVEGRTPCAPHRPIKTTSAKASNLRCMLPPEFETFFLASSGASAAPDRIAVRRGLDRTGTWLRRRGRSRASGTGSERVHCSCQRVFHCD